MCGRTLEGPQPLTHSRRHARPDIAASNTTLVRARSDNSSISIATTITASKTTPASSLNGLRSKNGPQPLTHRHARPDSNASSSTLANSDKSELSIATAASASTTTTTCSLKRHRGENNNNDNKTAYYHPAFDYSKKQIDELSDSEVKKLLATGVLADVASSTTTLDRNFNRSPEPMALPCYALLNVASSVITLDRNRNNNLLAAAKTTATAAKKLTSTTTASSSLKRNRNNYDSIQTYHHPAMDYSNEQIDKLNCLIAKSKSLCLRES